MARKTNRVLITTKEEIEQINPENMELLDDFLNYLETTDHSPSSIKVYKSNLNIFFVYLLKYCKNKDFVDIKKRDIMNFQNFLIKNGLSPARIRVLKSSISSLGIFIENILDEEEKWEDFRNIVNRIPAPNSNPVREKTVISDDELDYLLDKLVENNRIQIATFVAMCAFSGARKSEMIQYKRSFFTDETVRNGLYVTPEIRTKGKGVLGKPLQKYCIKSKVDKYLDLWDKERERLNVTTDDLFVVKHNDEYRCAKESTITWWMKICSDILGKESYCHSYRHFFVSTLVRQNIPLDIVKDIVGHNSSEVTALYNDNPKEDSFMKYFSEDGIKQVETKNLSEL
ncbi:site-specific integrase [uncultured Clostridium sp.]|uniref:tyrosine-type recombinase/integrase n=1 Tax=uncultured Clostridium sp. TaxID=59620 RepID=UPI0032177EFD